jgi:DNA-binding NarL/FixJ family response regulator
MFLNVKQKVMKRIRILIVDDHTIVRDGIKALLCLSSDMEIVGEAENGNEAVRKVEETKPDVVLMDISMPFLDGIGATKRITEVSKGTKVIMLTQYEEREEVLQAIEAGAKGFISKKAASTELIQAIRAVFSGGAYFSPQVARLLIDECKVKGRKRASFGPLTSREREVLKLIGEGYSDKEIAEILFLSPKTVESHKAKIMEKLHMRKRVELVKYAIKKGIVKA